MDNDKNKIKRVKLVITNTMILILFIAFPSLKAETMRIAKTNGDIVEVEIENVDNISFNLAGSSMHDFEILAKIPIKFLKNYPNPFNPVTTISYDLMNAGEVGLAIFNSRGQLVLEKEIGMLEVGSHKFQFDGSKYNSGVYFYKISINDVVLTKKMIMVK